MFNFWKKKKPATLMPIVAKDRGEVVKVAAARPLHLSGPISPAREVRSVARLGRINATLEMLQATDPNSPRIPPLMREARIINVYLED